MNSFKFFVCLRLIAIDTYYSIYIIYLCFFCECKIYNKHHDPMRSLFKMQSFPNSIYFTWSISVYWMRNRKNLFQYLFKSDFYIYNAKQLHWNKHLEKTQEVTDIQYIMHFITDIKIFVVVVVVFLRNWKEKNVESYGNLYKRKTAQGFEEWKFRFFFLQDFQNETELMLVGSDGTRL